MEHRSLLSICDVRTLRPVFMTILCVPLSYSFSLLLLSIFIYNFCGLYNLDFKYIILPLYVSCSKICIKLMELRKKLINVCNFILSISVSAPPL